MIVSASYRTDIPAYYGDWFLNRLAAGFADVRNPYGGKPYRVDLRPDAVSGFVFWTRNPQPFTAALERVREMDLPFVVQMTVTGYPRGLEQGTPALAAAEDALLRLADRWGPRAVVWRYDPVLLTEAMPEAWHLERIAGLARRFEGAVDECVLSFAQIYAKSRRNLNKAGVAWTDPPASEKRRILGGLARIAAGAGIGATVCAAPDLAGPGLPPARCIDAARLSDVAGGTIKAKTKGARPGCLCAESRDIGAYDACGQGCVYCYANASRDAAARTLARHDPAATSLAPLPRAAGAD